MPSTNMLRTARLPASRCINPHQQIDVKRAQKPVVFLGLASNLGSHQKRPKKPAGEAGVLALLSGHGPAPYSLDPLARKEPWTANSVRPTKPINEICEDTSRTP
jgi:hypothetical protein